MRETRLLCLVGVSTIILACGSTGTTGGSGSAPSPAANAKQPALVTPENVAAGKELYDKAVCIQCHGPGANGSQNGPPLSDKQWLHGGGRFDQIVSIIKDGILLNDVVGGYSRGMPARGQRLRGNDITLLTDDQVNKIAAYIWSLSNEVK